MVIESFLQLLIFENAAATSDLLYIIRAALNLLQQLLVSLVLHMVVRVVFLYLSPIPNLLTLLPALFLQTLIQHFP